MTKYILICITTILSFFSVNAQQPAPCGTNITEADMQTFYNRDKSHLIKGSNAVVHIPVTYHLVSDDNGNGAYTLSETFNLHCSLVEDFAPSDVIFYIHDIVYHNSSYYDTMGLGAASSMFNNENIDNTCNIFIVEDAKSGTNSVCGFSYLASYGFFLNGNGIVLDEGCVQAGSTTLTHEMGHYLNLPHTFSGWENQDFFSTNNVQNWQRERVNGSNCTSTGDGFCDTPPDYLSSRWDCVSFATLTDPNGQTFTADEKNYMSYSSDECMQYFKPEQQAEVNAAAGNYRPYLLSMLVPDMTPVAMANTTYPQNNATNLSNNAITFTWTESVGADGYLVEFTQGNFFNVLKSELVYTNSLTLTDLNQNANYKWRVKAFTYANVCTDYSPERSFSTAPFTTTANVINVFCPGDLNGTVTINGSTTANSYTLYELNSLTSVYEQVSVNASNTFNNLSPNNYKVKVLNTNGDESNVFFTVSDADPIVIQLNLVSSSIFSTVSGGTGPYNYIWSNGVNGVNNASPSIGENLLYISDANGCFKSASIVYEPSVDPSTSIKLLNLVDFNLYPNPIVGDFLNLEFSLETNLNPILEMFSITGKRLVNKQIANTNATFSDRIKVSSFSKGVYFIKITAGSESITRKVII